MARISETEEFARDWDWFAVDAAGNIGHFTTAGLRALPESVRSDREGAELLLSYFEATESKTGFSVRPEAKTDSGGWGLGGQERYLKSFAEMSGKGLFSYDTQMLHGPEAQYYLVTRPDRPLVMTDLPEEIRSLLARTVSSVQLDHSEYIAESETLTW